jgi:hypothetical protein
MHRILSFVNLQSLKNIKFTVSVKKNQGFKKERFLEIKSLFFQTSFFFTSEISEISEEQAVQAWKYRQGDFYFQAQTVCSSLVSLVKKKVVKLKDRS